MKSRRDVLRTAGELAGVGLTASFAGCTGSLLGGDGGDGSADYTRWTFDPEALDEETQRMSVSVVKMAGLVGTESLPDGYVEDLRESVDEEYEGEIEPEDVELGISVGGANVFRGSIDGDAVVDALDLEETGERGGFTLYADADETTVIALGDGYLVRRNAGFGEETLDAAREEVELLIDAYEGDANRLADVNEDFGRLTNALPAGHVLNGSVRLERGTETGNESESGSELASGTAIDVGSDVSTVYAVFVYEDEADVAVDDVREDFEGELNEAEVDLEFIDSWESDRVATLEYEADTETFFEE